MFFFAWSLVLSAINYARRQRLVAVLQRHLESPQAVETGLICRRLIRVVPFGTHITTDDGAQRPVSAENTSSALVRAPSEPILSSDKSMAVLYRTEDLEIVACTKPEPLRITDWSLFSFKATAQKSVFLPHDAPRVSFIATFKPNPAYSSRRGSSTLVDEVEIVADEDRLSVAGPSGTRPSSPSPSTLLVGDDDVPNDVLPICMLSQVANRIAFRRLHPNEVLYETDIEKFFSIVFQWSENALGEIDGRAIVDKITTVQLPDLSVSGHLGVQSTLPYASTSALSGYRRSTQSLTLLEYLHMKELLGDYIQQVGGYGGYYPSMTPLSRGSTVGSACWSPAGSELALNRSSSPIETHARVGDRSSGFLSSPEHSVPAYLRNLREQRHQKSRRRRTSSLNNSFSPRTSMAMVAPPSCSMSTSGTSESIAAADDSNAFVTPDDGARTSLEPSATSTTTSTPRNQSGRSSGHATPSSASSSTTTVPSLASAFVEQNGAIKEELCTPQSTARTPRTPRCRIHDELEEFIAKSLKANQQQQKAPSELPGGSRVSSQRRTTESSSVLPPPGPPHTTKKKSTPTTKRRRRFSVTSSFAKMTEGIAKKLQLTINGTTMEPMCRKRFVSLIPMSDAREAQKYVNNGNASCRRRSLSPIPVSFQRAFPAGDSTMLANTSAIAKAKLLDDFSLRRRSVTPTRRRFHTITSQSGSTGKGEPKPPTKPPVILVYTNNNAELYRRIFTSINGIIPENTYTIFHLSTRALMTEPWTDENAVCVLVADTKYLNDLAWSKLQSYFVHSGKIIFLCQNSLLANLTHCESAKKQASILKNAFGHRNASMALGKEFEQFLKKSMKTLAKEKEVSETFHAKDIVGGYRYSVVLQKKKDQPLLLYMENSQNNASALFSDATPDELISGNGNLVSDVMQRLGIKLVDHKTLDTLTRGYLMCDPDRRTWDMEGLTYGHEIGSYPQFFIQPAEQVANFPDQFPRPTEMLLPVEVRQRKHGLPLSAEFDTERYFSHLTTKSLGRALIFIPVCTTTMAISRSLSAAIPQTDGILVVAGHQTAGSGRSGNQWLSPKGCAMMTFNFNVPLDSTLGQSATFIQHILAISIVDGVQRLVADMVPGDDAPPFDLKIKWPNDIYFGRQFKMGGILVTSSLVNGYLQCTIGAGVNVANAKPTVCLNDMLPADCEQELTVEDVIASTVNRFEHFCKLFEQAGKQKFLEVYYKYWLHTREEVSVQNADSGVKEQVVIRGLDPYGYLEVRSKQTGKVFSVHDDGNTFDMMKGLIRPKHRL